MKKINLYFSINLTSQSPDAQIISIGIVSDKIDEEELHSSLQNAETTLEGYFNLSDSPKSFYAELNDFDIERCDEKVKENVIDKLKYEHHNKKLKKKGARLGLPSYIMEPPIGFKGDNTDVSLADTSGIKINLNTWLDKFKDYEIQFIGDKCSWEWVKFVELIGEWKVINIDITDELSKAVTISDEEFYNKRTELATKGGRFFSVKAIERTYDYQEYKTGSPILPSNISPEPMDLNTVLALKNEISMRKASQICRYVYLGGEFENPRNASVGEEVFSIWSNKYEDTEVIKTISHNDHGIKSNPEDYCRLNDMYWSYNDMVLIQRNALWNAKVIKEIYNKIM